jgi:hypothetical protein
MKVDLRYQMTLPCGYKAASVSIGRTDRPMRDRVLNYERAVGALEQVDLPLRHFFINEKAASHVYAREITIKKGIAAVGRVHKFSCINIVSKGKLLVATEDGVKVVEGPCTWVSEAGCKRALYTLEDTIWTTIHLTDETDIAKIKDELGTVTYEEYLAYCKALELEDKREPDQTGP